MLRALIAHRLGARPRSWRRCAAPCRAPLDALLPLVYDDVAAGLHPVARRSLLAHLIKLRDDGRAVVDGAVDDAAATWRAAG